VGGSHKKLPDLHFGFWKNKSCPDSLSLLYSDIVNTFDNNKIVGAVFMNIRAAYNNVLINIPIQRLAEMNIPKIMLKFIFSITSERYLSIKFNTVDVIRRVTCGLPQGSVLSPLLYNIYTVSMDKSIKGISKVLQFVDNVVIYSMHTNPNEALPKLENSARELS
jgi:hypothetical protein